MNGTVDISTRYKNFTTPLLLDGAMGSLLQKTQGINDKHLWTSIANYSNPEVVKEIHENYIQAGAEIISSNTFRTNPVALLNSEYDFAPEFLAKKGIEIAKEAIGEKNVYLCGVNAPAEDCYKVERYVAAPILEYNHKKHIEVLYEAGADFILNETMSHFDEIELVTNFCTQNDIPFTVSLFTSDGKTILSSEKLSEIIIFLLQSKALSISFNCLKLKNLESLLAVLPKDAKYSFYLNCGNGNFTDKTISCGLDAPQYLENIAKYINNRTFFVGACCGSNINHIKILRKHIDETFTS